MRLGKRRTNFTSVSKNSVVKRLYGDHDFVEERHRHRYEVNPEVIDELEKNGLKFVGRSTDGERMEIMELEDHQYFVAVQYHPEYISRPLKPSPPYLGLILASTGKLQNFFGKGSKLSPRLSFFSYHKLIYLILPHFIGIRTQVVYQSATRSKMTQLTKLIRH